MNDTIVALATPLGRSGIGVIRLSGADSLRIVRQITRDKNFDPKTRYATLKKICDPASDEVLDESIITYFQAPQSFTGEDVIEISCHGSPIVLRQIIDFCLHLDARMADAGEFTLRALANGRMDLSQAEAVRDLIDAQTVAAAKQSVRQLGGEVSHQLQPIKDELLEIIVLLESALEFVEDDLPEYQIDQARENLFEIVEELERMAKTFKVGRLLREGLKVALVGRPNVGKSSLFNALLGQDRAIVTEIAGTTRDQLHEKITIENIPISLVDTAGLRETSDTVESLGVERARRAMAESDLAVVILDGSQKLYEEDLDILTQAQQMQHLIVVNKIDLFESSSHFGEIQSAMINPHSTFVKISAKTGEGLDLLRDSITKPFLASEVDNSGFLVSDARHHDLLLRSRSEVETSISSLTAQMSEEIILIGLHNALRYLGQITGETTTEDVLTKIFSTFCIGK